MDSGAGAEHLVSFCLGGVPIDFARGRLSRDKDALRNDKNN